MRIQVAFPTPAQSVHMSGAARLRLTFIQSPYSSVSSSTDLAVGHRKRRPQGVS